MPGKADPIVIVGGGIAGAAAAAALAAKGNDVLMLEQAPEFKEIGAGVQFGPNAVKMLRRLGLSDAFNHLAILPEAAVMLDSVTGETVVEIPYGEAFSKRFGAPYTLVHRADLHQALLDLVKSSGRVEQHINTRIVDIEERDDGVTVVADDGRTFGGSALIGADGLWSVIRNRVVGDGSPRVSGHVTYRAVLPVAEMPEHLRSSKMTLWAGDKVHSVCYPLRGGEFYNLAATFHSDRYEQGWDAFGDADELHARFVGKHPSLLQILGKIETWRMWVLCDRDPVKNWSTERITLIGDAAHPTLQYLGQGAAMSLEDAVCIAAELDASGGNFAVAARAYQEKRYLRTARVQIQSRLYGEVYHADGVAREVRNQLLSSTGMSLESMAWMYDYEL